MSSQRKFPEPEEEIVRFDGTLQSTSYTITNGTKLAKELLNLETEPFEKYGSIEHGFTPNKKAGCLTCIVIVPTTLVEILCEKGVFDADFTPQTRTVANENGTTTISIDMNGPDDLIFDGEKLDGNPTGSFKTHTFCLEITIRIVGHWIKHLSEQQRTDYKFPSNKYGSKIQDIVRRIKSLRYNLSEIWDQDSYNFVPFENHDEFIALYKS